MMVAPTARRRSGRAFARRTLLATTATVLDRLRPVAPPTIWFALMAYRSAAGAGPVLTRPQARRALVLAPHPDDETIGCGGCMALLAEAGADVRVVVASSGEASVSDRSQSARATAQSRRSEVESACAVLGADVEVHLGLPDGELTSHVEAMTASIDALLDHFRPDIVFVPWALDGHPDHQAVCRALAACPGLQAPTVVWCYEVWSALPPNRMVDISPWWDRKSAALRAHSSAAASFDTTAHLALNRWRSIAGLGGTGQAEAYLVLGAEQFRQLTDVTR